jgi:hypothetical protein
MRKIDKNYLLTNGNYLLNEFGFVLKVISLASLMVFFIVAQNLKESRKNYTALGNAKIKEISNSANIYTKIHQTNLK